MSHAWRHSTRALPVMTRPRSETILVFSIAIIGSIVLGAILGGGGFPPRLRQSSGLELSHGGGAGAQPALVVQAARETGRRTDTARPMAPRHSAPRTARRRAKHPRRPAHRRTATHRKAAAARRPSRQAPAAVASPQPVAVAHTRSAAPAPRT